LNEFILKLVYDVHFLLNNLLQKTIPILLLVFAGKIFIVRFHICISRRIKIFLNIRDITPIQIVNTFVCKMQMHNSFTIGDSTKLKNCQNNIFLLMVISVSPCYLWFWGRGRFFFDWNSKRNIQNQLSLH